MKLSQKCIFFFLFCANIAFGQQNFFNVPSSDITEKNHVFFQQQFNFSQNIAQSNSTFSYGLGNQTEIGVNMLNLTFANYDRFTKEDNPIDGQPLGPLCMINIQKAFKLGQNLKLSVGTQIGSNISDIKDIHIANYSYVNMIEYIHLTHTKLVQGLYFGENDYLGSGPLNTLYTKAPIGLQLGIEQPVWKDKLSFQADYISGKHGLGETVLGGCYYLSKHFVLSAGVQIPNAKGESQKAIVIEFTYI